MYPVSERRPGWSVCRWFSDGAVSNEFAVAVDGNEMDDEANSQSFDPPKQPPAGRRSHRD